MIQCVRCREPWNEDEVYRHEAMSEEETTLFLQGRGCPCCNFGTTTHVAGPAIRTTTDTLREQASQDTIETLLEDLYEFYEGESSLVCTFLETAA